MDNGKTLLAVCSLAAALTGCGGDSLDEGKAAGVYQGTTSTGQPFYALVAKNDELWTIYATPANSGVGRTGLIYGLGAAEAGKFTAKDLKDFGYSPALPWAFDGTYLAGKSINGTLRRDDISVTLSAAAIPPATFDFSVPANVAFISGQWTISTATNDSASVTIAPDGKLSGRDGSCNFSGQIAPRSDSTNVYVHTVTFGPAPCVLPDQTVTGVAITLVNGLSSRQLIIAGVDGKRAAAAVYFGSKPL